MTAILPAVEAIQVCPLRPQQGKIWHGLAFDPRAYDCSLPDTPMTSVTCWD